MDKLERLMNLMATLIDTETPLTAAEIHERVPGYPDNAESFRRSFERDKGTLRDMGVPLRIEDKPGTVPAIAAYQIRKDEYYLRDPGLTPDELAALHLAASVVQLEGAPTADAFWKLGGVAGEGHTDGAVTPAVDVSDDVGVMFGAVIDRRVLRLRYHGKDRVLHPWRLDYQRGHWYLSAFDTDAGEARVFRTDRVEGPVVTEGEAGAFHHPDTAVPGLRLEPWEIGLDDPVSTELAVDAELAPAVVHHLGSERIEQRRPDGSIVFRIPVRNPDGFRSFVLGLLDHAEVLSPPEMRAAIVDWLEELAA